MIEQSYEAGRVRSSASGPAQIALLVEDDALVALIVEENLRDLGFDPHTVLDAASATRALADGLEPALAVIDVGLPDERGDQLAHRLRRHYPTLRVIIASGHDEMELRSRFADDRSVAVLGKPYTESDLATVVQSLGLATNRAT